MAEPKSSLEATAQARERLALAVQSANLGFWDWDMCADKVRYSHEWKSQLGCKDDEISDDFSEWESRLHPDDRKRALAALEASIQKPYPRYQSEFRLRHKDGSYRWIMAQGLLQCDEGGHPARLLCTHADITDRKGVEEALRTSEQMYAALYNSAPFATALSRLPDGVAVSVNDAFVRLFGYTRAEILGKSSPDLGIADADSRGKVFEELHAHGVVRNFECRRRTKSGELRWMLLNIDRVEIEEQPYAITTIEDITERKQAEARSAQLTRLYATLSQVNQAIVRAKDRQELFDAICRVATQYGGFRVAWIGLLDEATGDVRPVAADGLDIRQWPLPIVNIANGVAKNGLVATAVRTSKLITTDNMASDERTLPFREFINTDDSESLAAVPLKLPGKTIGALCLIYPGSGFFVAEGEMQLLSEMGTDISFALDKMESEKERQRAEEAVQLSEEKFRKAFMTSPDAVTLTRVDDGQYVLTNDGFTRTFGYAEAEVIGKTSTQIGVWTEPEKRKLFVEAVNKDGSVRDFEARFRRKDGVIIDALVSSAVLVLDGVPHILSVTHDISARKRSEARILQLSRLYATLSQVNQAIVHTKERSELYRAICKVAAEFGRFSMAWIGVVDEASGDVRPVASNNPEMTSWPSPYVNLRTGTFVNGPVAVAVRSSRLVTDGDVKSGDPVYSLQGEFREHGIRSTASVPFGVEGQVIGVLTLSSAQPGFFDTAEEKRLLEEMGQDISFAVETMQIEAERRRAKDDLNLNHERLQRFQESNVLGIVTADATGSVMQANDYYLDLLGVSREDLLSGTIDWRKFTPPEWIPADEKAIRELNERGVCTPYEKEYVRRDGTRISVLLADAKLPGPSQEIVAFVLDITERKQAEQALVDSEAKFRMLFDKSTFAIGLATFEEGVLVDVNEAAESLLGYSRLEMIGRKSVEFGLGSAFRESALATLDAGGAVREVERTLTTKSGQSKTALVTMNGLMIGGRRYMLMTAQDITERKRAEARVLQLARLYATLSQVNETIVRAKNRDELYQTICNVAVDYGNFALAWVGLLDEASGDIKPAAATGLDAHAWPFPLVNIREGEMANGAMANAVRTGKAGTAKDLQEDPWLHPLREGFSKYGYRSAASVPFSLRGKTIGVLTLVSTEPSFFEAEDEVRLLDEMGSDISFALETIENSAERQRAKEKVEEQVRRLSALRSIDSAISSSMDLRVTLDILLDHAVPLLHADAASVLLLNESSGELEYAAGRGFRSSAMSRSRVRLGQSYAGTAALERHVVSVPNLQTEAVPFARAELSVSEGFLSYHAAPLISKGRIRGVLEAFHRHPLAPDQDWINLLETLAEQTALAISDAELFSGLQQSKMELVLAYRETIEGWSRALDLRDKETEGHTQRVTEITLRLARTLGMNDDQLVHVRHGALLHDIGKMGVPDSILLKPGPLTDLEWESMRKHPEYAYLLMSPIAYLRPAIDIPYCHHEKWDGSGYPRKLGGERIPLAARLFSVVDVWDALLSDRPYRAGWPEDKVREYLRAEAGKSFDARAVDAFLGLDLTGLTFKT